MQTCANLINNTFNIISTQLIGRNEVSSTLKRLTLAKDHLVEVLTLANLDSRVLTILVGDISGFNTFIQYVLRKINYSTLSLTTLNDVQPAYTSTENISTSINTSDSSSSLLSESIDEARNIRVASPVFKYDYKLGNYLTKELISGFPNLFISQIQVTGGIKKSA